jgi:hypothetical protein
MRGCAGEEELRERRLAGNEIDRGHEWYTAACKWERKKE